MEKQYQPNDFWLTRVVYTNKSRKFLIVLDLKCTQILWMYELLAGNEIIETAENKIPVSNTNAIYAMFDSDENINRLKYGKKVEDYYQIPRT